MRKTSETTSYYTPPVFLPGSWWDSIAPLADWMKAELRKAYDSGYTDGHKEAKIKRIIDDINRQNRKIS